MKNRLTVIIPFLNESKEVYNTVKNLRENSDYDFDLILINDNSTDSYDYESVAGEYSARYIEHKERIGVAASRDEGVRLCNTDCFLFLDAHMRLYRRDWVKLLLEELDKEDKSLLCGATITLDVEGNEKTDRPIGYGAFFNFGDLSIHWLCESSMPEGDIAEIPCVLGASYACKKDYWLHLHGLDGLKSYGYDEQLISLKVWLDHGKCKVVKNLKFGHIFRDKELVPYEISDRDFNPTWQSI
jgi:glycosyltransferase involved in cell wall biosynthesis